MSILKTLLLYVFESGVIAAMAFVFMDLTSKQTAMFALITFAIFLFTDQILFRFFGNVIVFPDEQPKNKLLELSLPPTYLSAPQPPNVAPPPTYPSVSSAPLQSPNVVSSPTYSSAPPPTYSSASSTPPQPPNVSAPVSSLDTDSTNFQSGAGIERMLYGQFGKPYQVPAK